MQEIYYKSKTILIVEDEAIIAAVTAEIVRKFGFSVITANSGEAAFEIALSNENIDLILMDIDLGSGIDGPETARRILEKRTLPIVFLTSHSEKEYVDRVKEITRYGYIIKNSGDFVLRSSIDMAFELFEARKKTQEREERLQRAEMISGFGSLELDLTKKFFAASEGARMIYGLGEEELDLATVQKLALPKYRPMLDAALKEHLTNGTPYDVEFEIKRPTDEKIIFIHSIAKYDAGRNVLIGTIHDITKQKLAEDARNESNLKLMSLASNIPAFIAYVNADTLKYEFVNDAFERSFGIPREKIIGSHIKDIISEKNYQFALKYINEARAGNPSSYENSFDLVSGKHWLSVNYTPVIDASGHVVSIVVLTYDITERKLAEEDGVRNESRLRKLIDILQRPSDTVQGFLDYALDQAILLTESKIGYIYHYDEQRREFVLNTWSKEVMAECSVVEPSTCYELDKTGIWGEAVRQKRPIIINDYQSADPLKKGYPEGHVRLSKFMTVPVFRGDEIVGVVGLANKKTDYNETDILQISLLTDAVWKVIGQMRAEEALRESEEKFRLLYTGMDQGLALHEIITDADGKPVDYVFLDINDSYTRLLGVTREMSIGKRIREVMPEVEQYWIDIFGRVALTGESSYYENYLKTTGKYYSTYTYCPKKNHFAVLVTDITDRKVAEEKIKTLLAEKELLLKEVHHRIKNNMNTVAGLMSLQLDTLKEPSAVAALKDARSRVVSMMLLYDKLYRSDDFKETSFKEYLSPLVDEIVDNFPNKEIVKVEKNIEDFMIDPKRTYYLGILINELLTNIMKYAFTGRDNGLITISAMAFDNRAAIVVRDNGVGIPETLDIASSAGFGLQLVDMMTRQLHGAMKIERDAGTKFTLEFKL